MADDFDDDLFNAYNEASDQKPMENSHDTFEDEFADALDTTNTATANKDRMMHEDDNNNNNNNNRQAPPPPPPQQQRQQNYNNYTHQQRYQNQNQNQQQTVMMGGVPMPYQMALAYQQQMQQMMANPLQFQMMQQQYRQMQQQQQQQHHQQQQHRRPYQQRQHQQDDKETLDRKMFVGGLDWDTTDDSLKEHFSKYGPVASCSVMRDVATGQSRGFAFLSMVNAEDVDKVLEAGEHVVDGKKIDPKRAVSRSDAAAAAASSPGAGDGAGGGSAAPSTEKIFVGGISSNVDRDEFKAFFEQFGAVADATLMVDRQTGRPRGFGFITFEDAQAVDRALDTNPADLMIKDKQVEIKRATPKSASSSASQRMRQPPNTRYAGAAARFGAGQPQYPYAAMAAAAASYYGGGGAPRHMQQDDMDDHQDRRSYSRDHHHRSSRHRDGSRDDRYRDDRSGGGAVHASSSSRNQSSYRPY